MILDEMTEDIQATQDWATELYDKSFSPYFKDVKELYQKLEDTKRPITDAELEDILTTLPLQLITVSEILSQFKISKEVATLTLKQKEADYIKNSSASSLTQRKEEAATAVLEYKLVQTVYASVISRVENEINFSRELIMSAKKIWDARRSTDGINPTGGAVTTELPDYVVTGDAPTHPSRNVSGTAQTYIK